MINQFAGNSIPTPYPTPIATLPINEIYSADFTLLIPKINALAKPKLISSKEQMIMTKGQTSISILGIAYWRM